MEDLNEIRKRILIGTKEEDIINIQGVTFPIYFKNFENAIENFEVRDDDIWVCTYPKAGTTWTQEMVWCIGNDLNFEGAKERLCSRFPYLEISTLYDWKKLVKNYSNLTEQRIVQSILLDSVEYTKNLPSPRFIKTHVPFHLLPRQLRTFEKRAKIICVARNSKDSCISCFHHYRLYNNIMSHGSFEDFCKLYLGNKLVYGSYWEYVKGFVEHRDNENVLFLKYEDMKVNLSSVVRKTATFLNKKLDNHQVDLLTKHLSFESMKKNSAAIYENNILKQNGKTGGNLCFIRKGQAGQWKNEMPKEYVEKFDEKDKKYSKETGYQF